MVSHDIMVQGVDLQGTSDKKPVIVQMHDDDFPARFLQDLASPDMTPISHAAVVDLTTPQPLFQPVQRMLNLALVELNCNSLGFPRLDPTRIQSAVLVIRRVFRRPGINGGQPFDDPNTLSAWLRSPTGTFSWVQLTPDQEILDPDPKLRPQLVSGQPELDRRLANMLLATENTESTTPAFAAPPATCANLNRTALYAVIPTASSEVSDTQPMQSSQIDPGNLTDSLPTMLRSIVDIPDRLVPASGATVDYRWMSDDFLNAVYPPAQNSSPANPPVPDPNVVAFQSFSTALRMLHTVFGAFDGSDNGNAILGILNNHKVNFADPQTNPSIGTGDFYQSAKAALLDYNAYPSISPPVPGAPAPPTLLMPADWDWLTGSDQTALVNALITKITPATPSAQTALSPQGRFQDSTRLYKLRVFFRIKGESPQCPAALVWSDYSDSFYIAAWYDSGVRPHPPIQLPDPTLDFLKKAKPNCSFHVPANLMNAMQGTTLSGLMKGAGGGSGLNLDWICGFNISIITICAFFVLTIFLILLNIVFFWLPFVKICIPFPSPSSASPDDGTP
jgi:hypothetical protein